MVKIFNHTLYRYTLDATCFCFTLGNCTDLIAEMICLGDIFAFDAIMGKKDVMELSRPGLPGHTLSCLCINGDIFGELDK